MEIINVKNTKPFITKDLSKIREILSHRNSSIKNQSLAEAVVCPGKSTEEHCHINTEEIYYVLSGMGIVIIEGQKRKVKKGDGVAILPGKKHKLINTGDKKLVVLCCCSPCYEHGDTVITEKR